LLRLVIEDLPYRSGRKLKGPATPGLNSSYRRD